MAAGDTEAARISETALAALFSEQVHERNRSIPDILNSGFVCIQSHHEILERGEAQVLGVFRRPVGRGWELHRLALQIHAVAGGQKARRNDWSQIIDLALARHSTCAAHAISTTSSQKLSRYIKYYHYKMNKEVEGRN
jgi:hypothetical protein